MFVFRCLLTASTITSSVFKPGILACIIRPVIVYIADHIHMVRHTYLHTHSLTLDSLPLESARADLRSYLTFKSAPAVLQSLTHTNRHTQIGDIFADSMSFLDTSQADLRLDLTLKSAPADIIVHTHTKPQTQIMVNFRSFQVPSEHISLKLI